MASSARIDELKQKFDENPRRYFAPLANEFRKVGDLEQAILICEAYLPQQPGHMSGHIVYGQALYESSRLDEAQGVFQTALSLDPENLIALRHLGDIAARQGDATSARRWYERVLEADPRNEEIQGLINGLSEERSAAHEAPAPAAAPGYAEPRSAPPATPVQAFAAAPDAHFATPDVVEAEMPELLDLDVSLPESTPPAAEPAAAAPREAAPATPSGSEFEPTSVADFDRTPETRDLMPEPSGMAEGFESSEFAAPSAEIAQEPGLQSAFEDETGVNGAAIAPLAGLEAAPGISTPEPAPVADAFPELDEPLPADEELVLPPHGDSMAASAPPVAPPSHEEGLLDFDMPVVEEAPARAEAPSSPAIPPELPPEVIAAEAELIDAAGVPAPAAEAATTEAVPEPESVGPELTFVDVEATSEAPAAEAEPELEPEPVQAAQRPFVTETMAELYLKQGFRTEALAVYEQLSAANPSDERLAERVASLRTETAPAPAAGPPVREFFARFASRRPWERAAAAAPPSENDFDFTEPEVPAELPPEVIAAEAAELTGEAAPASPPTDESRTAADAPTAAGPSGGSIDALFGNKPTGSTEDSAASALSQAFGGSPDAPPIAGNPARQATGELSLDSVFREGGPRGARNSQGFSFDQFFSHSAEGEGTSGGGASQENPASGEPAERTADDIEQFNSWLQGLKQR
ncbi:MAG TPA: tetratricopeptide repeat protein [Gemmatimonadaceae bacterium]